MRSSTPLRRTTRLGARFCALTGSAVFGILFVLAWATSTLADVPASSAFLALFTQQAMQSPQGEFASGLASALGLGALVGALVAFFNLAAGALRR